MKYILILVVFYQGHGATMDHIEFNTMQDCKAAGTAAKAEFGGVFSSSYYVCVVKP